jgi:RNA-directed DNA polymerase
MASNVNFYEAVHKYNRLVEEVAPSPEMKKQFVYSMNSYLGIVKHYCTAEMTPKPTQKREGRGFSKIIS